MLDQVRVPGAVCLRVGEQPAHDVELVVRAARSAPSASLSLADVAKVQSVPCLDDLRVVLEDVGEAVAGEDALPEVVGLEPVGVGRVARAVVPAEVERQEPRSLALQVGAEAHLVVVHGEVHDAAAELEELLARVAVALVLLDGVLDRLLGEAVLQLEGGDRQAVDEQAQVERALRLVAAVAELARDAEAVRRRSARRPWRCPARACRRTASRVVRPVLDAVAQHVDGAALADLALEPRQELPARRSVLFELQALERLRLRLDEEGEQLADVDAVLAVVVVGPAAEPARAGQ